MPTSTGRPTGIRTGSGRQLNLKWSIGAQHVLYHKDGTWFHVLERFPAAFCDPHGYVLFFNKEQYLNSPHLRIGVRTAVPAGISQLPGYVRMEQ
jgi:5-methylcytosine-specific restriction enzyme A